MSDTVRISELVCAKCGYVSKAGDTVCPNDGTALRASQQLDLTGTVLDGKYKTVSLLGSGGMGSVYEAKHLLLDSTVAVKVLHMQAAPGEAERIRRFNQEGKMISALKHPNIISALDFGVHESNFAYLVMDYAEGKSLHDELRICKRIPPDRAVRLFVQVCDALEYAHSKGIVHRDIKPSNIMLVKTAAGEDQVKLLDFGVAKMMDDSSSGLSALTKTGMVFGSPPYMSPEQCLGKPPSPQSDIYSLGCVMYETLTGITPINGENSLQVLHNQISLLPLEFKELPLQLDVPPVIESIVLKSLAKKPEERYQTMTELKHDLNRWQSDKSFRGAAISKPRRLPTKLVAGAAIVLIASAAAAYISSSHSNQAPIATIKLSTTKLAAPPAVAPDSTAKSAEHALDQNLVTADSALDAGEYDKAAEIYTLAAETIDKADKPNKPVLLLTLDKLANCYCRQGLAKDAEFHSVLARVAPLARQLNRSEVVSQLQLQHLNQLRTDGQYDNALAESKELYNNLKKDPDHKEEDLKAALMSIEESYLLAGKQADETKFVNAETMNAKRTGNKPLVAILTSLKEHELRTSTKQHGGSERDLDIRASAATPNQPVEQPKVLNVPFQPFQRKLDSDLQPIKEHGAAMASDLAFMKGMALERARKYDEAEQVFSRIMQSDPDGTLLKARDLVSLGRVQCKQNNKMEGQANVTKALNVIDGLSGAPDNIRVPLLIDAEYFYSQRDWRTAQLLASTLVHKLESNSETSGPFYCRSLFFYGSTGMRLKQYGLANDKLKACLQVWTRLNPLERKVLSEPDRLHLMEDIGACSMQLKDLPAAKKALLEVEKMSSGFDPNDLHMFTIYTLGAQYAKATGDIPTARIKGQKMLDVATACNDDARINYSKRFLSGLK